MSKKRKRIRREATGREQAERIWQFLHDLVTQLELERREQRAQEPLHLQSPQERKHIVGLLAAHGIRVDAEASIIYIDDLKRKPSNAVKGTLHHLVTVCRFKLIDSSDPLREIDPWKL